MNTGFGYISIIDTLLSILTEIIFAQYCKDISRYSMDVSTITRDGLVAPLSWYREHFTEIPLQNFTTAILIANTNN